MKLKDYQRAARELRVLRLELVAMHALGARTTLERYRGCIDVARLRTWHEALGVPFSTTYEMLRQNRHIILNTPAT